MAIVSRMNAPMILAPIVEPSPSAAPMALSGLREGGANASMASLRTGRAGRRGRPSRPVVATERASA